MKRIHSPQGLKFNRIKISLLLSSFVLTSALSTSMVGQALPFMKAADRDDNPLVAPDVIPKVKLTKEQQASYDAAIKNGQTYLQQQSLDMAKLCFQQALQLDGNSVPAHIGMAVCLSNEKDLGPAEFELTEALRVQPNNTEARFLLGQLMMKENHWDEAGGQFLQILKFEPRNHAARGNLAVCLQQLGQIDNAIGQYDYILRENPKSADAAYNLGAAYEFKKNIETAIVYYKKAIQIDPKYYNAYCSIAKCLVGKKMYTDGLTLLKHASEMNPKNYYGFLVYGYIYEQMGPKYKKLAIESYTRAVALNPNDWDSKRSLQRVLEKGHEKELAELKRLQMPQ